MRKQLIIAGIISFIFSGFAFVHSHTTETGADNTLKYFKAHIPPLINAAKALRNAINNITEDSVSVEIARSKLAACRNEYKSIEFFVEYFFGSTVSRFNVPPVFEVEEPSLEFQWPVGFQVIENLLFDEKAYLQKKELRSNTDVIILTAEGFESLLYGRQFTDAGILESFRLELVRISTLNITGYDAPLLKTGIHESATALLAFKENIKPYLQTNKAMADSITFYLNHAINMLSTNNDFDKFNRMLFLKAAMLPLQKYTALLIKSLHGQAHEATALNYEANHIFDNRFLNIAAFDTTAIPASKPLIELGKRLFFESKLSGNNKRSCITCHQPEKYFTDGLNKSIAFDEQHVVRRNAPSILYTAYQYNNFWDGRAPTLTNQVLVVTSSANEMNADTVQIVKKLVAYRKYRKLFAKAFPQKKITESISIRNIGAAISAYEKSLPVMTSAFDKYINGDETAMSPQQIKGFNLFMGKAQCGTCHFAPVFNGLLPPLYNISEVESLGITTNADFDKPVADADSGRYHFMPSQFYIGAFKTPTVRNAAKTAPYMHNGSLQNLTEVMEFYNKGGGNGMGLYHPNQTLSDKPLNLTKEEITELVSFIESLTDEPLWLKK
ncbi:MAG: cytochrome C peroxidase [Chitinophagaceae bacterium]|nr:cytochrome C peroxidase [Chitinophagaceae bacterium]